MSRAILVVVTLAVLAGGGVSIAQTSSIGARSRRAEERNPPEKPSREEPRIERNLIYEKHSWIATRPRPPKTFKVNDLITIIVRERLKFEADADLQTKKTYDIKSELSAFLKPIDGGLGASTFLRGKPNIDYKFKNNLKTEADTNAENKLTTRITGKIIDIKPNGVLVIEAKRKVSYGDEINQITITGMCRKEDVTADNTVLSTQLAETVVTVTPEGALKAASSRGWIPKLLDLLKPF